MPDALLQDSLTLQERTALVVDQNARIVAVTPAASLPADIPKTVFPGELWTAAPVLAHAHLESFDAPSEEWGGAGFSTWVAQLLAWRQRQGRLSAPASAAASLAELLHFGCGLVATHVAEAGADGTAYQAVLPHVLAMQEVFAPAAADFDGEFLTTIQAGAAIALHAPFSIADEVAAAVFQAAAGQLVSIHLGEHEEERQLLASGTGPLADLLTSRGRSLKQQRWASPVDWLDAVGGLQPGTLVVHGSNLNVAELQRLADAKVGVVFCPGTHHYFERPLPAFVAAGVALPALGCDSRASNSCLDPLRELQLAYAMMPEPGAQAWWHALTSTGAAVLQQPTWGALTLGKRATVLRLTLQHQATPELSAAGVCQALCEGWRPPRRLDDCAPIK